MKITSVKKYKGTTYEVVIDEERKIYLHADIKPIIRFLPEPNSIPPP